MISKINIIVEYLELILLAITFILTFASIMRFSSILIKLVCLEVITNLLLAAIAIWADIHHAAVFIDIGLTLSLIMFLGVVAYYRYLYSGVITHG